MVILKLYLQYLGWSNELKQLRGEYWLVDKITYIIIRIHIHCKEGKSSFRSLGWFQCSSWIVTQTIKRPPWDTFCPNAQSSVMCVESTGALRSDTWLVGLLYSGAAAPPKCIDSVVVIMQHNWFKIEAKSTVFIQFVGLLVFEGYSPDCRTKAAQAEPVSTRCRRNGAWPPLRGLSWAPEPEVSRRIWASYRHARITSFAMKLATAVLRAWHHVSRE